MRNGQGAAVAPEAAELAAGLLDRSVGLLDCDGDHVQHAMHVNTGHPPVQGLKSFHRLARIKGARFDMKFRNDSNLTIWPDACPLTPVGDVDPNRFLSPRRC